MCQVFDFPSYGYRPGLIGRLAAMQAEFYSPSYGFDLRYEAQTVTSLAAFLRDFDPARDGLWLVLKGDALVGCIAIDAQENGSAQLRWFYLLPAARGRGLGKALLEKALTFCTQVGYEEVYLFTNPELKAAVRLYKQAGFVLVDNYLDDSWGAPITVQRYRYRLSPRTRVPGSGGVRQKTSHIH